MFENYDDILTVDDIAEALKLALHKLIRLYNQDKSMPLKKERVGVYLKVGW